MSENYKEIILNNGSITLVDSEDYQRLNQYKWHVSSGYATTGKKQGFTKNTRLHHLVINTPIGMYVDHINRNKLDNRKSNLRLATHKENQRNKQAPKSYSKFKGVYWHKRAKKWAVQIMLDGGAFYVGLYTNEVEAALEYDLAAVQFHGRFACTNYLLGILTEQDVLQLKRELNND